MNMHLYVPVVRDLLLGCFSRPTQRTAQTLPDNYVDNKRSGTVGPDVRLSRQGSRSVFHSDVIRLRQPPLQGIAANDHRPGRPLEEIESTARNALVIVR